VVVNGVFAGSVIADSAACWGAWFPFAAFVSWVGAVALAHRVLGIRELRDLPALLRGQPRQE
jgi:cytochrome c biogenesis factor